MIQAFRFQKAYSPVFVCNSQAGTLIPEAIRESMTEAGQQAGASRMLTRLIDVSILERAAVISADVSMHVINLNETEDSELLLPRVTDSENAIYIDDAQPSQELAERLVKQFYHPFHAKIREETQRIVSQFGHALIIDVQVSQSDDPAAITIEFVEERMPQKLRASLSNWQCLISEREQVCTLKSNRTGGAVVRNAHLIDNVVALKVGFNPANFVDPDDGEFDFESGRELIKSSESLMATFMRWAESKKLP